MGSPWTGGQRNVPTRLRDTTVVVAVVRTRPRAIPLAMITMRKLIHGFPWARSRSIRPKIPVWISEIFVCRMERYFPPGRTDLVLFPLEHISHQELLDKMLKDSDEVAVLSAVSCFMWRSLARIQNSTLPWYLWEKFTNFSRERVCKPGELTTGNSERPVQIFSRKSDPNDFFVDQEQARTMADHFAFSVVLTRKTRRHLVAFHR